MDSDLLFKQNILKLLVATQALDRAFFLHEEISCLIFSTIELCSDSKFCFDFLKYSAMISLLTLLATIITGCSDYTIFFFLSKTTFTFLSLTNSSRSRSSSVPFIKEIAC